MLSRTLAALLAAAGWVVVPATTAVAEDDAQGAVIEVVAAEDGAAAAPPIQVIATENDGAPNAAPPGEEKRGRYRVQGKIVIVGPDGKRQEIEIDKESDEPPEDVLLPRHIPRVRVVAPYGAPGQAARIPVPAPQTVLSGQQPYRIAIAKAFAKRGDAEQFMIGVHGEAADAALRAQLKLGDAGVVVKSVLADSPAKKAGLQEHDVLLKAGDKDLKEAKDLLDAVQAAGEQPLTLSFLRAGERQSVAVTPEKRKAEDVFAYVADPEHQDLRKWFQKNNFDIEILQGAPPEFHVQAIRPGIMVHAPQAAAPVPVAPPRAAPDVEQKLDALSKQIEALQKAVEELQKK